MSAQETVKEVVNNHNLLRIATLDADGMPCVRSVDYAMGESENVLFFITQKTSRKIQQIKSNGTIAFAIDHDCKSMEELQALKYIKGTGTASVIEDPAEMQNAFGLLLQKFPYLKDLPGDPSDFVGVKVAFKDALVTDNTIQFGHTESVAY